MNNARSKKWYDHLWMVELCYLFLGLFNILFAWLGLLCFFIPLLIAGIGGSKVYCGRYCGRGQLFQLIGGRFGLSLKNDVPRWMKSRIFRYGFLIFFLAMFGIMVFQTYLVASGAESLREAIKLFWTFRVPWEWTYSGSIFPDWVAQFGFGFYSVMLTSLLIGLIVMIFFKPRTWCAFCPMGTMTQTICKLKNRKSNT